MEQSDREPLLSLDRPATTTTGGATAISPDAWTAQRRALEAVAHADVYQVAVQRRAEPVGMTYPAREVLGL
jgi:hypothetical protein